MFFLPVVRSSTALLSNNHLHPSPREPPLSLPQTQVRHLDIRHVLCAVGAVCGESRAADELHPDGTNLAWKNSEKERTRTRTSSGVAKTQPLNGLNLEYI